MFLILDKVLHLIQTRLSTKEKTMFISDYQNSRYLNYGFIHDRYDLTQYGQLVWKVFDLETNQYLLLVVNSDHYVIDIKQ